MKKQLFIGMGSLFFITLTTLSCPIRIQNDSTIPAYVLTAPITDKLADVATEKQIEEAISALDNPQKTVDYEKLRPAEISKVGNASTKTYYVYMQADKNGVDGGTFIRIAQIQLTRCIPEKEKALWWEKHFIKISQLKDGALNEGQKDYLAFTRVQSLSGYTLNKEYKKLYQQLIPNWKTNNSQESLTERYYQEKSERTVSPQKIKKSAMQRQAEKAEKNEAAIRFIEDYA